MMAEVIEFPSLDAKIKRVEELVGLLEDCGFLTSVLRTEGNRAGELAFELMGPWDFSKAEPLIVELRVLYYFDKEVRTWLYEERFHLGALYYEACTSSALSFDERVAAE